MVLSLYGGSMSYELKVRGDVSFDFFKDQVDDCQVSFASKDWPGYFEYLFTLKDDEAGSFLCKVYNNLVDSIIVYGGPPEHILKKLAKVLELSGGRLFDGRNRIRGE